MSLHRHLLFQFFEPVERDVDLVVRSFFGGVGLGFGEHDNEVLTVRRDVIASGAVENDSLDGQRRGLSDYGESRFCLDVHRNNLSGSSGLIDDIEELFPIWRPQGIVRVAAAGDPVFCTAVRRKRSDINVAAAGFR